MEKSEIQNYLVDRRLERDKKFPSNELNQLIDLFNRKSKQIESAFALKDEWKGRINAEAILIENAFNDFYFLGSIKKRHRVVETINKRMQGLSPRLDRRTGGWFLNPFSHRDPEGNVKRILKQPEILILNSWGNLATVIDHVNPAFVHQCAYCKKIFFSKQIKKYHGPMRIGEEIFNCRRKFFDEKYRLEGRNAERQKHYRLRKKRKVKVRKST